MKFLDANIFIRYLASPTTAADARRHRACSRLFQSIERGEVLATTSQVVVHEVLYVMTSSRHYGFTNANAAALLKAPMTLRGMHLHDKTLVLDAMSLFEAHEFLDFSDALTMVLAQHQGDEILTYDRGFDRVPGVTRSEPAP